MADFSTSALLEIELDDQSLSDARDDIESELENAASLSSGAPGGGSARAGGGGRSTRRQLDSIISQDQRRNRLLEKLVRQGEDDEGRGRGLGGPGGLTGQLLGGLAGALGAVGVGALVASSADIVPDDLIGGVPTIDPGDLIGGVPDIAVDDIVGAVPDIVPDDLIGGVPAVAVTDLIDSAADVTGEVVLDALIASPVVLTAGQVLDQIVEGGAGTGTSSPAGTAAGERTLPEPSGTGAGADVNQGEPVRGPGAPSGADAPDINAAAGAAAAGAAGVGSAAVAGGQRLAGRARGAVPAGGSGVGFPAVGSIIADRLSDRTRFNPRSAVGDTAAASTGAVTGTTGSQVDVTVRNDVSVDSPDAQRLRQRLREELRGDVAEEVIRRIEGQFTGIR